MKKIINRAEILVLILGFLFILIWNGMRWTGYQPYTVLTQSMVPTVPPGSLVIVQEADPDSLKEGDIITFQAAEGIVTHRIDSVGEEGFITKGDANVNTDAEPVTKEQILGTPALIIPGAGKLLDRLFGPAGVILIVGVLFLFVFLEILASLLENRKEEKSPVKAAEEMSV